HLLGPQVAAVDDAKRAEKLLAEEIRAPAVVGQRRDRADDLIDAALVGAVVALQTPQRDDDGRRHAEALLDFRQQRGVGLGLLQPVLITAAAGHAAGELLEALLEDALPAVAADDRRVEGEAVERRRDGPPGNPLGRGLLPESGHPGLEAAGVAAPRRGVGRYG